MPIGNAASLNKEIEAWIAKVESTVKDFNKKDRRRILIRASRPVVKAVRDKTPKGAAVHYRYANGKRIKYNPGNLRRSAGRLILRKTRDAFVGPRFAKNRVAEYGGVGQPTDGYYARMLFGSAAAFNRRVLQPAISETATQVRSEVAKESLRIIKNRAASRGIKTR
jgi:predicted DNA binding CopG/RHH family protein